MDCREFERFLWDGPGVLTPEMETHLDTCPKCRESYARFRQMFILAEQSELDRSEAFWQNFSSSVWKKIDKAEPRPDTGQSALWRRPALSFRRLSLSIGLASVAVIILVLVVADLTKKAPISSPPLATDNYRTFDVKLEAPPTESKDLATAERPDAKKPIQKAAEEKSAQKENMAIASASTEEAKAVESAVAAPDTSADLTVIANTPTFGSMRGGRAQESMSAAPSTIAQNDNFVPASKAIKGELETALMAAPQITADTNQMITFRQFSILSEPKLEKQGDSTTVSIDAVYLTDDGLEDTKIEVSQSVSADKIIDTKPERLRLSRLYTQTAHFSEPQVITLSKMPHPKHLVTPNFPSLANSLGKEGEVWVRAYLDESGKVKEAEIYKNSDSDYGFEEEALSAAYKNEFEPLEVDGQKLPAWIIYKVKFIRSK